MSCFYAVPIYLNIKKILFMISFWKIIVIPNIFKKYSNPCLESPTNLIYNKKLIHKTCACATTINRHLWTYN